MHHKMVDFIPLRIRFSLWLCFGHPPAALLSDTTHNHLRSLSPSISISLVPALSCSSVMGDHSLAVCGKNVIDPGHQRTDFGVNTWTVRLSTAPAPRDNSLQLPVTHKRAARVTLSRGEGEEEEEEEREVYSPSHPIKVAHNVQVSESEYLTSILASLQVSGTHHAVSNPALVGVFTVLIRQNGDFDALQVKRVEHCSWEQKDFYLYQSIQIICVHLSHVMQAEDKNHWLYSKSPSWEMNAFIEGLCSDTFTHLKGHERTVSCDHMINDVKNKVDFSRLSGAPHLDQRRWSPIQTPCTYPQVWDRLRAEQ